MLEKQTMTIKELADVAGVSGQTIRRVANKLYPELKKNGVASEYDHAQSMSIIKETRKKNIVAPLQNGKLPLQNEKVDIQSIIQATAEATAKAVIQAMNSRPPIPQIAETTVDYMTAFGYAKKSGMTTDIEYIKKFGRVAKRICNEQGMTIKKLDHERYGHVNAYPVHVLEIAWKYV